jgi:hypothetical protein
MRALLGDSRRTNHPCIIPQWPRLRAELVLFGDAEVARRTAIIERIRSAERCIDRDKHGGEELERHALKHEHEPA